MGQSCSSSSSAKSVQGHSSHNISKSKRNSNVEGATGAGGQGVSGGAGTRKKQIRQQESVQSADASQRQSNERRRSSAKQSSSAISTPSATPLVDAQLPLSRSPPPAMSILLQVDQPSPRPTTESVEDDPSSSRDVDEIENSLSRRISHGMEHEKVKRKVSHEQQELLKVSGRNEEPLFGPSKRSPSSSLVIQKLSASSEIAATSNSSDTSSLLYANPLLPKTDRDPPLQSSASTESPPLAVVPRSIPSPFRRSPNAPSPVVHTGSSDDTVSMTSSGNQQSDGRDAFGAQLQFLQQKAGSFSLSNNPANGVGTSLASSGRRATGSSAVTFFIPTIAVLDGQQPPPGGSISDGPTPSAGPLLPSNSPPLQPVLRNPLASRADSNSKVDVSDWEPLALPPFVQVPSATGRTSSLDQIRNLSDEALFKLFSNIRTNGTLQRFLVDTGCVEPPKTLALTAPTGGTSATHHKGHSTEFSLKRAIATSDDTRARLSDAQRFGDLIRRILVRVMVLERCQGPNGNSRQQCDDIGDVDIAHEPSDIASNPLHWFRYVISKFRTLEDEDGSDVTLSFLQERLSRLHRVTIMNFQAMSGLDNYEKRVLKDEGGLSTQSASSSQPTAMSNFLSPSSYFPAASTSALSLSAQLPTISSPPITEILPGLFICCVSNVTSDLFIRERGIDCILSCVGPLCPTGTKLFEADGVTEVTAPQLAHISHLLTEEQATCGAHTGDDDDCVTSMRSFSILASGKSHLYLMRLQLRSTDYNQVGTSADHGSLPKQQEVLLHAMTVRGNPSYRIDRHFTESANFLKEMYLTRRRNVLVVCGLGVSRAPTIVMAFLCEVLNLSVEEALVLLRVGRPQSRPNDAFLFHLLYHYSPAALL